jgi:hypothetical protein
MEMIKDEDEFWKAMADRRDIQEKECPVVIDFNKLRKICSRKSNALCGILKYYDCSIVNCPLIISKFNKKDINKAFEMERESDQIVSFKRDT